LPPLTGRDAAANNLANVLDFTQSARTAPQYPEPPVVSGDACSATVASAQRLGTPSERNAWQGVGNLASRHGWRL
jgi:phospholipase C